MSIQERRREMDVDYAIDRMLAEHEGLPASRLRPLVISVSDFGRGQVVRHRVIGQHPEAEGDRQD